MDVRVIILCVFLFSSIFSDTSIAQSPSLEAIRNLDYDEEQMMFPSFTTTATTEHDTYPGNVPIVNPTTPGSANPTNPTFPPSPTTTGPRTPTTNPTNPTTGPPNTPRSSGGGSWCVASQSASDTALQVALDYACGYSGTDCSAIQPGASCYEPNTVRDHASYAFNAYYQKNPGPTSCVFGGAAQLTNTDPSHGSCHYPSSTTTTTSPPSIPMMPPPVPTTPPSFPMTPPSMTTPGNPLTPGGGAGYGSEPTGYDYGSEPTGTPNSAHTVPGNLMMLAATSLLVLSVVVSNHP